MIDFMRGLYTRYGYTDALQVRDRELAARELADVDLEAVDEAH